MREIKFRGMDLRGRWFTGNLAILHKDLRSTGNKAGHYISNSAGAPFAYAVRPETVGQYTGLKDKNGTEIYEDDIVVDTAKNTHLITFDEHSYFFHKIYDSWLEKDVFKRKQRSWLSGLFTKDFEVIGNIYENKELINHD